MVYLVPLGGAIMNIHEFTQSWACPRGKTQRNGAENIMHSPEIASCLMEYLFRNDNKVLMLIINERITYDGAILGYNLI